MPRDRWLALSVLLLAAAVALHAVAPAFAQEAPGTLPPECRNVRVGTAKELASLMADLQAKGHDQFLTTGALVCGWR